MTEPRSLVLPRLTREKARTASVLAVPRRALAVLEIGQDAVLRAMPDPDYQAPCGPATMRVGLTWDGRPLSIRCPRAALDVIYGVLDDVDPARVPPGLAAILLEAALLPAIEAAEAATGVDIRIVDVATAEGPTSNEVLPLAIDGGGQRWGLRVEDDLAQDRVPYDPMLTDLMALWPEEPWPASRLPLPAALRLGTTRLTYAELRSLRPGDALLREVGLEAGGMLVVAESWIAEATQDAGSCRLVAALLPVSGLDKGWIMHDADEPLNGMVAIGDPDELPVRLVFDVGQLDVELGDLRRLGAGSVLELRRAPQDLVRISANGKPIGVGALVDIDGAVGVRIARIFDLD